jgi:4-amino-4-deoxy-L-arabinose transferase-like glycosyltransferase
MFRSTPPHFATSSLAPRGSALRAPSVHVAAALLLWAFMWFLLPTWFEPVPPSDNIEQLVWSQGLELGYHKHPPLPTWILIGAEQILPASVPLTYALSILGMGVGGFFLWRLAAQLLGRSAALPVILATACIAFYSYRAHIYNHNTVLVPCVYAAAWFFLSAVRSYKLSQWILLGAACAAGMLTKYQFVVILATFALIAARLKLYRQPQVLRGAAIAAATAAALLAPHIWWLCSNDFPPFRYASQMLLAQLPPLERVDISAGFILQQLRDVLPPILMRVVAACLSRRSA